MTNLYILFGLIVVLSLALSFLYSNHIYQLEKERLADMALKTESLYSNWEKGLIVETKLQDYMDAMAYVSKSKLYILNIDNGNIKNLKGLDLANEDLDDYLYEDLKDIINGKEVFRNSQYTETFDTRMIFYGRPLIEGDQIKGAIIIFSPISSVSRNIRVMVTIILSISLISMIIVGVILFVSAKKIAKPIKLVRDSALKIANGETIEDIDNSLYSELNELTDAFNYMKSELIRIESDKKAFISMISHEVKTPLTVISGYLEAIHDGVIDGSEVTEALDIIYQETHRLTQLTKDIVTKTSNKDLEIYLEPTIFKLRPLLEDIIKLSSVNIKKNIEFTLSCEQNITIYADENKIRQVLSNLISNSIKYSNHSVNINIYCFVKEDSLCLQVKDNGIGIKKVYLEKVFQKYYRVRNISEPFEGSGLGLSIVKKLIELHKGKIEISSELKKGTTVTMWFPL
jgi:signal transduction histidine kinase